MFSQRFRTGSVSVRKPRAPAVQPGGGVSEFTDKDGREIPEGTPCKKFLGGDTPTRKRCCGTVGGRWGWLWCTSATTKCTLEKSRCTRKFWLGGFLSRHPGFSDGVGPAPAPRGGRPGRERHAPAPPPHARATRDLVRAPPSCCPGTIPMHHPHGTATHCTRHRRWDERRPLVPSHTFCIKNTQF